MDGRIDVSESGNVQIAIDNLISVGEASRKGVSWLAYQAESGQDMVILRNGKPAAAVVGAYTMRRLAYVEELESKQAQLIELFVDTPVQ